MRSSKAKIFKGPPPIILDFNRLDLYILCCNSILISCLISRTINLEEVK